MTTVIKIVWNWKNNGHTPMKKKELRNSDRYISSTLDRVFYTLGEKESWRNTPSWMAEGRQDMAAICYQGKKKVISYKGN